MKATAALFSAVLLCACTWFESTPIPVDDAGEDVARDETVDPAADEGDDEGAADPDLPPGDNGDFDDPPGDVPDVPDAEEPDGPASCPFQSLHMLVEHSCALTAAGAAWCWGRNDNGELGDGTLIARNLPVPATAPAFSSRLITGGVIYTCALAESGGLACWGGNVDGQLGNGTTTDSLAAVEVSGLASGVAMAEGGYHHMCAFTSGGVLYCWGLNDYGQVGDGTVNSRSAPVRVTGIADDTGIWSLSAGGYHSCVVTGSRQTLCWGNNGNGQIGSTAVDFSAVPLAVGGLTEEASAVSCGRNHTCLVLESGGVACFGRNSNGELGNGTFTESAAPVRVSGLSAGVVDLQAGNYHNCVLTESGGVKCWGWNHTGQLGDGTLDDRGTPVDVTGLTSGVAAISVGSGHACAMLTSGEILCWGSNDSGELGNGSLADATVPTALRCD